MPHLQRVALIIADELVWRRYTDGNDVNASCRHFQEGSCDFPNLDMLKGLSLQDEDSLKILRQLMEECGEFNVLELSQTIWSRDRSFLHLKADMQELAILNGCQQRELACLNYHSRCSARYVS